MTDEAWTAVERAVDKMRQRLSSAAHPEDFQGIGHLARETLISLAQAVHDRELMPTVDGIDPSDTDAKRRLDAFIVASLPGSSKDELRKVARAAVSLADSVTHMRAATDLEARLALLATESVVSTIALIAGRTLNSSCQQWRGVQIGTRYFAWDGPLIHTLPDRPPVACPPALPDALKALGGTPRFGVSRKLESHFAHGYSEVFETDRSSWRRRLLHMGDPDQTLLVKPSPMDLT